jgi:FKBP-type peptidyl-prolyl cis-trans isomerase FklB
MRIRLPTASIMVLLVAGCSSGDEGASGQALDKVNYSIGYQIGSDFRQQDVAINPEVVLRGMADALSGTRPALDRTEMRTTLAQLQNEVTASEQETQRDVAAQNLASAESFLAENARQPGVETLASGLQYKVLEQGSGASPGAHDTVTVHYRGTLIDGSEFDSSYSRNQPATFPVDRVIAGWTEALQLMHEGAKWQLFIPPGLAYGEKGAGKRIPPNSALVFEVELIAVK